MLPKCLKTHFKPVWKRNSKKGERDKPPAGPTLSHSAHSCARLDLPAASPPRVRTRPPRPSGRTPATGGGASHSDKGLTRSEGQHGLPLPPPSTLSPLSTLSRSRPHNNHQSLHCCHSAITAKPSELAADNILHPNSALSTPRASPPPCRASAHAQPWWLAPWWALGMAGVWPELWRASGYDVNPILPPLLPLFHVFLTCSTPRMLLCASEPRRVTGDDRAMASSATMHDDKPRAGLEGPQLGHQRTCLIAGSRLVPTLMLESSPSTRSPHRGAPLRRRRWHVGLRVHCKS